MKAVVVCCGLAVSIAWNAMAMSDAPVPTETPVPAATPAPDVPESRKPEEGRQSAATEVKNKVDILSRMKLSGYIQAQYVHDESSVNELSGLTTTRNRDQFSVRRGRIKFTYQALPTARFVLQPDISSSGVTLKDGYVQLTEPWTSWKNSLIAGQFIWPFGFELMYSSSSREMPERSRVVRTLFPGERDRGVQLTGRGFAERFIYQVAVVNGTGTIQSTDLNKRKDFIGRLGGKFGPLTVGVSGYNGSDLIATAAAPQGIELDKERTGLDFQWTTPLPGLAVRGEYIGGKERGADVDGWYAYLIQRVGKRHQFAIRADEYDPDTDLSNNATLTFGGAYIFDWDANSKIHIAWEHPKLETRDPDDDVLTVRFQYSF